MTTFYSIDAANERLPRLRELLLRLRDERDELVRLRDRLVELEDRDEAALASRPAGPVSPSADDARDEDDAPLSAVAGPPVRSDPEVVGDAPRIRLRMQGIVDRMQASVSQIDQWGIALRDIDTGLIDFPALVTGRQVCLCWRLGEGSIDWWHELGTGFAGRRPLSELE
ncbi:MAG TPA: DUF2203 domain-containing protein [Candidatus Saccharimonadales bacterium]|nr:DUF2203 domain-containing protein [Candidatus Saccharimonadales bacterium]